MPQTRATLKKFQQMKNICPQHRYAFITTHSSQNTVRGMYIISEFVLPGCLRPIFIWVNWEVEWCAKCQFLGKLTYFHPPYDTNWKAKILRFVELHRKLNSPHSPILFLFLFCNFFSIVSVTRSLTQILKILIVTLPNPPLPNPSHIKKRRVTTTCAEVKPNRRTAARCATTTTIQQTKTAIHTSPPPRMLWCICRRSSFGNMIYCEHRNCQIKWFHMDCLKISIVPGGDWYWVV